MTDFTPDVQDEEDAFFVAPEAVVAGEPSGEDEFVAEPVVLTRAERRRAEGAEAPSLLTPVTARMNSRLQGDEVHADADYADVSEQGVSYSLRIGEAVLSEILIGGIASPDDEDFPREQLKESVAGLNIAKLERYFANAYGAELVMENEYGSLVLKFNLPYDDAGLSESSIEYMGYRVMKETKIGQVHIDNLIADTMVSGAAAALGYEWSAANNRYLKVQVKSFSANREQYRLMQDNATEFYALSNKSVTSNRGKWTKAADLYSAAANRVYDIGSRVRKSDLSVEGQLRRESAGYRVAAGNEADAQTREAYLDLADRFTEIARLAEDLS